MASVMAGYITRVVTITYGAQHSRVSAHIPPRFTRVRGPLISDAMPSNSDRLPLRSRGRSAGPCGSAARAPRVPGLWHWTLNQIEAYGARWGDNPLGLKARIGLGPKGGRRGRGPQDYLFQRRGAGDG